MFAFACQIVRADSGAWAVNAGGNWSDAANWLSGVVAGGTGATAYFTNMPNSSAGGPVVTIDTNLVLNGVLHWNIDGSEFTYAAGRLPGTLDCYGIDMGTNGFTLTSSRRFRSRPR
jgi:hypothetical protein